MLGNIDYLMGLNCCYSKGNTPIIIGGVLTASNQLIEMKNRIKEKKQKPNEERDIEYYDDLAKEYDNLLDIYDTSLGIVKKGYDKYKDYRRDETEDKEDFSFNKGIKYPGSENRLITVSYDKTSNKKDIKEDALSIQNAIKKITERAKKNIERKDKLVKRQAEEALAKRQAEEALAKRQAEEALVKTQAEIPRNEMVALVKQNYNNMIRNPDYNQFITNSIMKELKLKHYPSGSNFEHFMINAYLPKKILDSKIDYLKNFPFKIHHFLPVQSIKNAIEKAGEYTPFDGYVLLPNGKYIILEFKYYNTSEFSINVETLKENFKLAGNKLSLKTGFPITRSKITGQVWSEKNKQWYDGSFVSKFTKKDNKNLFSDLTLQPDFKDPRNTIINNLDADILWYIMCSDGLYVYELSKDTDSFYIINNRMFKKNAHENLTEDKKNFFIDPNKLIKIN